MKKKNKIAFFLPNLQGGGAERITVELANMMSIRGYDTHIILADNNGPYLEKLNDMVVLHDQKQKNIKIAF